MNVAHFTVITPNRCGLYETTRELVAGLNKIGINSRLVDPTRTTNRLHPKGPSDRGAPIDDIEWAKNADIIVNHSGLGEHEKETNQPIVHVCHGRPMYSFITEMNGGPPVYSYQYNKSKDTRYKAVVTFWPEHIPYHEVMWDQPVHAITPPVDLERWSPNGPSGYNFNGLGGDKNIIITDAWREDINPFVAINAFALYNKENPGSKLHIYAAGKGKKGLGAILQKIKDQGGLGEVLPWVSGLDNVYRSADLTITPHQIAVRTIRESLACGCPVAKISHPDPDMLESGLDMGRKYPRLIAERDFNPDNTAKEFKAILDGIIR